MFSSNASQVSNDANYIEDVFSTWLYTGNDSTQTITNGIDLAGKGGLVWIKQRDLGRDHVLYDTSRGASNALTTNSTAAQATGFGGVSAFSSSGFTLNNFASEANALNGTYASWTFRKQPKFFDVVTYTGNGNSGPQTISHNLGSVPGVIICKSTTSVTSWGVYHRSLGATKGLYLNLTQAEQVNNTLWNDTAPTSTTFTVGASGGSSSSTNEAGQTYVAYLFAHNAGGFGLTGTDNVISCGSFTGDGTGAATVNLGYEPQWVMIKRTDAASDWELLDNMRGLFNYSPYTGSGKAANRLLANTSGAEQANYTGCGITATGFEYGNGYPSSTYIYIAIRRGPMKVPTDGTSVFSPNLSSSGTGTQITTGFPVDAQISNVTSGGNHDIYDRLRGVTSTTTQSAQYLVTNLTDAELTTTNQVRAWNNTGFQLASGLSGIPVAYWNFRRAPGFFDEVCWTGDGTSNRTLTHNLTVVPTLIIIKNRTTFSYQWSVYQSSIFNVGGKYELVLNNDAAQYNSGNTNTPFSTSTAPTATQVTLGSGSACNSASSTYIAYLFATCAGVSKVGSYTGTGTTQTINCGFTAGARFVLIKRTDSTGDWYVWDSARGIVAGNDPYLLLNSTAAEVTSTDYIDTYSAGFEISSTAPAAINASGGSFIFLAIS